MTTSSFTRELASIVAAAAAVVRVSRPCRVVAKAADDFVTDMDCRLQNEITGALQARFGEIAVLGEESLCEDDRLPSECFLVDPLDGTGNWIAGLPFCAVSVAHIVNGHTVLAAVADVYRDVVYTAAKGQGAWRNERKLRVTEEPAKLFTLSTGLLFRTHQQPAAFTALKSLGKFRNLGAQALNLCLVAEGSLALVGSVEARLWDDAAGRLIVSEAGARYDAGVDGGDIDRPFAPQYSIAAHPGVFGESYAALAPLLNPKNSIYGTGNA